MHGFWVGSMGIRTIGFVGIGTMGRGMVQNLLRNGFTVFAYNRTKEKASGIKHENLHVVDSPAEACEKSGVIITSVSDDSALRDVLFSEKGVFRMLEEGKTLIDCGTTSVDLTAEIAGECRKRKVNFLDAPVTGSKAGAEGGTLMFMVGGSKEAVEECAPVFNAMGKRIVHCGGNTSGQKAKIALNLAQSLVLQGYFEGIVLGMKNGVPLGSMLEIFDNSGAKSGVSSAKMPNVLRRDFSPHFRLDLMDKDVRLAKLEMEKLGLDLPLGNELVGVFREAMEKGWGKEDFSCLVRLLEEKYGVKVEQ